MSESFQWWSPLGLSVVLFLAIGLLWFLIGAATVPFQNRDVGQRIIFVSNRTDTEYFGGSPDELLVSGSPLFMLRTLLLTVLAGFLVLAGILFMTIAWFSLRQGQAWGLTALAISGVVAIGFWVVALLPYARASIRLSIGDLPPFIWIPAALILPATILGWIGLI